MGLAFVVADEDEEEEEEDEEEGVVGGIISTQIDWAPPISTYFVCYW